MPGHHHRAGALRQTNKKNKRSKSSKRSLTRAAGGRVAGGPRPAAASTMLAQSKAGRRNKQQQIREAKRQAIMRKKRGIDGGPPAPPRVVGIISLSRSRDIEERMRDFIISGADRVVGPDHDKKNMFVTCKFDVHKKDGHLTLLTSKSSLSSGNNVNLDDDDAVLAAMDLARICDVLLFVIDGDSPGTPGSSILEINVESDAITTEQSLKNAIGQRFDHLICGDRVLAALKAQGLPTPVTVLAKTEKDPLEKDDDQMTIQSTKSIRRSSIKRRLELKKYASRFATTEFGTGNDRVIEVDLTCMNDPDDEMDLEGGRLNSQKSASANLVRAICGMSASPAKWVANSPRPYLISESSEYDEATRELSLTGYVRGAAPFDCNSLVHVPNLGTFACKLVRQAPQPLSRQNKTGEMDTEEGAEEALLSDPKRQESLDMFATPDALEGEQNLIGFEEEDRASDGEEDNDGAQSSRPAGWSDYQAAWLDAIDDDIPEESADRGELAEELNRKPKSSDVASVGLDVVMDLDDANDVNPDDKRALLEQRRKQQEEHQEFPDEVEVDEEGKASERFARYRSLKSFRKSYWDPKENLPETYSSIYHFSCFKSTQRSVMNNLKDLINAAAKVEGRFWGRDPSVSEVNGASIEDESDNDEDLLVGCVPSGSHVTITLRDVPLSLIKPLLSNTGVISAVGLLPHENKVSVLHMGLCQPSTCEGTNEVPVKSKDVLTFRCGWRTWKGRPTFSQNNLNCDKHKFERFMPVGGAFFAASVFGPVTYTPCPVMVFRECDGSSEDGSSNVQRKELVATGSMIGADADRIIVKRIVLTGYPVRVHKRHATVKYMFYNPEDVKWFKPAGLYTKHGLQGNIVESVGDHGTMKCLFNAPIMQHDTVCLPLYKRLFPKLCNDDTQTGKSASERRLVVR